MMVGTTRIDLDEGLMHHRIAANPRGTLHGPLRSIALVLSHLFDHNLLPDLTDETILCNSITLNRRAS